MDLRLPNRGLRHDKEEALNDSRRAVQCEVTHLLPVPETSS